MSIRLVIGFFDNGKRSDFALKQEFSVQRGDLFMLCSCILAGHYDALQLSMVMLGGSGGRIKGGRNLDYLKNTNRQTSRLFLSMMDKMTVRPKTFGDVAAPLDEV